MVISEGRTRLGRRRMAGGGWLVGWWVDGEGIIYTFAQGDRLYSTALDRTKEEKAHTGHRERESNWHDMLHCTWVDWKQLNLSLVLLLG